MAASSIRLSLTGRRVDAEAVRRDKPATTTPAGARASALMHWAEAREAGHENACVYLGDRQLSFPRKELEGWGIDPESVGAKVKEEDDMPTKKKKAAKGKKKAAPKKAAPVKKDAGKRLTAKQFSLDLLAKNPDVTAKEWLRALQKQFPDTTQTPAGFYGYRRTAIETGVIKAKKA